ncbi:MAG: RNB domain-containing ribonuclease [Desulfatiglandaceae bacterium]
MYEGCIIEYIDQGRFMCSLCLQDKGGKLHLLTRLSREVNLPPKRAMLISRFSVDSTASREALLDKLRQIDEMRTELQAKVNPQELWELIHDQNESFDHRYLAQLVFGDDITDDHISAVVRALFEDRIYFKLKESQFLPNSPERVDELIRQKEEEARKEIILKEGSLWIREVFKGNHSAPPECKDEVIGLLTEAALQGQDASGARFAADLISRAGMSTIDDARKILVALGIWEEDENLDLIREGIEDEFSSAILDEASCVETPAIDKNGREDFTDLPCLTIDGPLTRDFDDAVSVQEDGDDLIIGVHIADAASFIAPGSMLDTTAMDRVSSLYLHRRQIPMLPETLSQGTLSLIEGQERPCLSLICRFNQHGVLKSSRFAPGIIRVRRQLVYEQVNSLLDQDRELQHLHRIALELRRNRFSAGALDLTLPDVKIGFDETGELTLALLNQDTPSRAIVEEFMIFYNLLAARWCSEKEIPILYRTQAPPSERISEEASNRLFYVFRQLRKLSPLQITVNPGGHSGLGVEIYTQCTSPIRRYLDLVVQRQMKAGLEGSAPPHSAEDLENLRMSVEPLLRRMAMIKRNRLRYWIIKYIAQNQGRIYPALVLSDTKTKYRVLLEDLMLVAEIKKQPEHQLLPGQQTSLRAVKADPWKDLLELDFTATDNR